METRARSGSIRLFHHDDFEWRVESLFLLQFFYSYFLPSVRVRMCRYTPHRRTHSQTKGKTNNSYRVKDAIWLLFEKIKTKSEWPAASCYSRTIALSVRPLKPKCFSAVKAVCTESNLFSSFPFFRFPIFLYATIDTILFRKSTQSFISFYVVCLAGYGFLWKTFENSTKKEKCWR